MKQMELPGGDYNIWDNNTIISGDLNLNDDEGGADYNTFTDNIIQTHSIESQADGNTWAYNLHVIDPKVGETDISGSPTFVGGAYPSSISGYALAPGSTGKSVAIDGADIGADIAHVGVSESPPASGSLDRVSNLRLVMGTSTRNLQNECANYASLHPEWIFCDDFESDAVMAGDGRYFEYNDDDGEFVRQSGVGVEGSAAMRVLWQAGETGAGSLLLGFGRNPSNYMNKGIKSGQDFKEIYYRMYLKNEANWEGSPYKLSRASVIAREDWSQAMIAHVWTEGEGDVFNK